MSPDAARLLADLARHATIFDFSQNKLGAELCQAFTDGVAATIAAEEAPDGTRWDELSPAYAATKARDFPGQPMGHRLDLMADPAQIAGDVIILANQAFATYGTDDDARAEAAAFQEGDPAQHRPARPFWGFTKASKQAADDLLSARLKAGIG